MAPATRLETFQRSSGLEQAGAAFLKAVEVGALPVYLRQLIMMRIFTVRPEESYAKIGATLVGLLQEENRTLHRVAAHLAAQERAEFITLLLAPSYEQFLAKVNWDEALDQATIQEKAMYAHYLQGFQAAVREALEFCLGTNGN